MAKYNLPDIEFAEKDSEKIEDEVISGYETAAGITLGAADPRKKLLQSQVPILAGQRSLIDYSAKQNLLAYATGEYLDHIGILVGCTRIAATAATATVRFTLSTTRTQNTLIAAGKRVTASDNVFFAVLSDTVIVAGSTHVDIKVQCTVPGIAGNDYAVGTLTTLVDPIPYVASVSNTTVSAGGIDEESDDAFRERTRDAPESFSCAGPTGAYEYWAKTASATIIDVAITSPSPGVVNIYPLITGGEIPGQEILDAVLTICSDSKIRPLTDKVQATAPEQVAYNIDVTYYIDKNNESVAASLRIAVDAALITYITWQKAKLGRDIDPSELIYKLKAVGASRVVVTSPIYQALGSSQVAKEGIISINYGGIES